jgi:sugar lactone lactonase YvrE
MSNTSPFLNSDETTPLELVGSFNVPLGNVTMTLNNRIIVSHHPMFETDIRVSEMISKTELKPFPDLRWNTPQIGTDEYLDAVLGLRSDGDGLVWLLDMGSRSLVQPKLLAYDTMRNQVARIVPIADAALSRHSELNDFVIDERHGKIYIADEGVGRGGDGSDGALVIVDIATGAARRCLAGSPCTTPEPGRSIVVDGRPMFRKGLLLKSPMQVGCDGIALDSASEWLYFGPLNGSRVYRLRVADLTDDNLDDARLLARAETWAERPNAGGMSIDEAGNLYLTEVGNRAVGVIPFTDQRYRTLARHPDMLWPDGLSFGPDGFCYVTIAQLPLSPPLNDGQNGSRPPYHLGRFRPLAPGRVGH